MSNDVKEGMVQIRDLLTSLSSTNNEEKEFIIKVIKKTVLSADSYGTCFLKVTVDIDKVFKQISPRKELRYDDVIWMMTENMSNEFPEFNTIRDRCKKYNLMLDVCFDSVDNFNIKCNGKTSGSYNFLMHVRL